MTAGDFITIDLIRWPRHGVRAWRAAVTTLETEPVTGMTGAVLTDISRGTTTRFVPWPFLGACGIVAGWSSLEAAHDAWGGRLAHLVPGRERFSLDGEITRVRGGGPYHHWMPKAGFEPIVESEPVVSIIHGLIRPRRLYAFLRDNAHATSRAIHHPGLRGTVALGRRGAIESTSLSAWTTARDAHDYAYAPGGHASAMKANLERDTHRVACFLQVRPLATSGSLGEWSACYPELPEAPRR